MEIRRWMSQPVHAVKPLDSIQHARELMDRHRVNQLPVLVNGRLIGIITDRDLREAFPSAFESPLFTRRKTLTAADPHQVAVEMVMTHDAMTVGPADSMADAARLMRTQRIGALPVVDGERVVGILTRSDVLAAFGDLAGIEEMRETGSPAATLGRHAPRAHEQEDQPRRITTQPKRSR